MKTTWVKKVSRGLLLAGLVGAGIGLAGCADEYAAYPGYHGGYYAGNSAPYSGAYGYPYRTYGPYYGGGYYGYGAPNYGYAPYGYSPYYGGGSVVVSTGRTYYSGNRAYVYRDRYGRLHRANAVNRTGQSSQRTTRTTTHRQRTTRVPQYQSDDETRYYPTR